MTTYAGATARSTRQSLTNLPSNWALQPKIDGAYCIATLDAAGTVNNLLTRTGQSFSASITADLRGVRIGSPDDILVGELEALTEAASRTAATRGYRCLHVFDALRLEGHAVDSLPYRDRRDLLLRSRAKLELEVGDDRPPLDNAGNAHARDGRFTPPIPTAWHRAPIVPQLPVKLAQRAWREWVELEGGEGLVAVNLNAPVGARGSKRKVKHTTTIDCTVLELCPRTLSLHWPAAGITFTVGTRKGINPRAGQVVEVALDGWYERTNLPRFPRLVRVRTDKISPCSTDF